MRATAFGVAGLSVLLVPAHSRAEGVLFEDTFKDGLSKKWGVVGLDKKDYRVKDGAGDAGPERRTEERPADAEGDPAVQVAHPDAERAIDDGDPVVPRARIGGPKGLSPFREPG